MSRCLCVIAFLFSIFFHLPTTAQSLPQQFRTNNLKNASISAYAIDLNSGEVILETIPQLNLVPASTQKLITTATAFEILGTNHLFTTSLVYTGKVEADSTLNGNLIIKGGGDPAFCSEYFPSHYSSIWKKWSKALKQKGIKKINGQLLYDASILEDQLVPNTWIWEDIGNYYGAGASGLSIADNKYTIVFRSSKAPNRPTKIIDIIPDIPDLQIENRVLSSNSQRDNAYIFGSPFEPKRVARGSIPKNRKRFSVKASMPNPPLYAATLALNRLQDYGIHFQSSKIEKYTPTKETIHIVAQQKSPKLTDIIEVTNHESVNLFAEHLLKAIGLKQYGKGTTKAGVKAIKQFWLQRELDTQNLFLVDGSGLSRFNAITAKQLTSILVKMSSTKFPETLAEPQKHGTLIYRFTNLPPTISVKAKTGSMTRVRALAGYLKSETKHIAFAFIVNNYTGSSFALEKAMDKWVLQLAK